VGNLETINIIFQGELELKDVWGTEKVRNLETINKILQGELELKDVWGT